MKFAQLKLRRDGMFSNINEVVQQLYLAEKSGYGFIVNWSKSCYREAGLKGDPWNYYFEDCFTRTQKHTEAGMEIVSGLPVACSKNNIITPRLKDGQCTPLLLPKNRKLANRLTKKYIQLKSGLQKKVSVYRASFADTRVLGLHIRGPGKTDGGSVEMSKRFSCKRGVPFTRYFEFVDAYLREFSSVQIFLCSDSQMVINEVIKHYGQRVRTFPADRSYYGEMHVKGHPENKDRIFSPYRLGEDVLLEAYLLAEADFLVHGNSNVTNFVLCKNPELKSRYIYAS